MIKKKETEICFHLCYNQMHQFVKLNSFFKQSFIPPSYMFLIKFFIVLLTESPDISEVCLSSGRENYLFFPISLYHTYQGGVLLSSPLRLPKGLLFCPRQHKIFLNLFGHYPNLSPKSFGNLFYFSVPGFGKGYRLQASDRWVCSFFGLVKYSSDWNVPITDFPMLLWFNCMKTFGIIPAVAVFLLSSCIHFKRPIQLKRNYSES